MVSFPNCKINLGLHIRAKREDGYHDLETVFFPAPFTDVLEVVAGEKNGKGSVEFIGSGLPLDTKDNICLKACELLGQRHDLPQLKLYLHKAIPAGAGLGGGSSDGAFTLKMLNDKFGLNLSTNELIDLALQLGSDCPFFIINKPCLATGRGEVLKKINLDLSGYRLALVNPGIHISTAWAFSRVTPRPPRQELESIITGPISRWTEVLLNDFEDPVFAEYPAIKKIKDELYRQGALYASLSGSGSTVFGLFEKDRSPAAAAFGPVFFHLLHIP